jgi:hypothetical protein
VGTVLERLPFSVVLEQGGRKPLELYRAYTPTAVHTTLTIQQGIRPYRRRFDAPTQDEIADLCLRSPEGVDLSRTRLHSIRYAEAFLEIDLFGRIVIKTEWEELQEVANPMRHSVQRALWQEHSEAKRQREQEQKDMLYRNISRSPFLENE